MAEKRLFSRLKGTDLPADYTAMVAEVFRSNFDAGLRRLEKIRPKPRFSALGSIYPDEIVLSVSLTHEGEIGATTVHASCDFDPKASSPKAEQLLAICVDALGGFYSQFLDPKHPELISQLAEGSLAALEGVPFTWTEVEVERRKVYLKVDRSNPLLEKMTDQWLEQNDPKLKSQKTKGEDDDLH